MHCPQDQADYGIDPKTGVVRYRFIHSGIRAIRRFYMEVVQLNAHMNATFDGNASSLLFPYVPFKELHTRMLSSGFYLSYLLLFRSIKQEKIQLGMLHKNTVIQSRLPISTQTVTSSAGLMNLARSPVSYHPYGQSELYRHGGRANLKTSSSRLKIVFVSDHLTTNHAIGHLLGSSICKLSSYNQLNVFVIVGSKINMIQPEILNCKTTNGINIIATKQYNVYQYKHLLLKEHFDVIIYPSLGMDVLTSHLATLRLAPVQAVWWGHPETSGQPDTIDWFLTCAGAEAKIQERKRGSGGSGGSGSMGAPDAMDGTNGATRITTSKIAVVVNQETFSKQVAVELFNYFDVDANGVLTLTECTTKAALDRPKLRLELYDVMIATPSIMPLVQNAKLETTINEITNLVQLHPATTLNDLHLLLQQESFQSLYNTVGGSGSGSGNGSESGSGSGKSGSSNRDGTGGTRGGTAKEGPEALFDFLDIDHNGLLTIRECIQKMIKIVSNSTKLSNELYDLIISTPSVVPLIETSSLNEKLSQIAQVVGDGTVSLKLFRSFFGKQGKKLKMNKQAALREKVDVRDQQEEPFDFRHNYVEKKIWPMEGMCGGNMLDPMLGKSKKRA